MSGSAWRGAAVAGEERISALLEGRFGQPCLLDGGRGVVDVETVMGEVTTDTLAHEVLEHQQSLRGLARIEGLLQAVV